MLTEPNAFWVRCQMACTTPEQKVAVVCEQGVHLQTTPQSCRRRQSNSRERLAGGQVEGGKLAISFNIH